MGPFRVKRLDVWLMDCSSLSIMFWHVHLIQIAEMRRLHGM
jgi:hypothetical protein